MGQGAGRRTKIVATIGPASEDPGVLAELVASGMDVARLGLAHGTLDEHLKRITDLRRVAEEAGRRVGILADLPGPKVRAAAFPEGGVFLAEGEALELAQGSTSSTTARIEVDHDGFLAALEPGDIVVIGDGFVTLTVERAGAEAANATVTNGGRVQGSPGVSLPSERLHLATPTDDDLALIPHLVAAEVDFLAVSFVSSAADIEAVRAAAGPDGPMLVAKIETARALAELDGIVGASDAIMVARGDLGIHVPMEDVPSHQKRIIRTCVAYGKPVITATQMLESMVNAPTPTRAEVSDVANAVLDGTDAVMLSGETAIGQDPANAVATMARIAARAERDADGLEWGRRLGRLQQAGVAADLVGPADQVTAAITAAAWRASIDIDVAAIICCTRSGATARAAARFHPGVPLLAVTPRPRTADQLSLTWGVQPVAVGESGSTDDLIDVAVEAVVERGLVASGDLVAVLAGNPLEPEPVTDVLRLLRVR